jgi:hypothetical protein
VDARNGWELQQKTVEVQRVRRQTKDKLKHMVGDHKRAMQNMVHERNTQVLAAKVKHEADVKNLLKQKDALVERTKEQRKNAKVALSCAVDKHDNLALRFSAVECANQKLVRNLNAERKKGEVLFERTSSLEKEVTTLAEVQEALASAEKEVEIATKSKVSLSKVVELGRNRAKAAKAVFNKKHKAREKSFEIELSNWQTKVQALTAQVAGLAEEARDARTVRASRHPFPLHCFIL